MFNADGTMVVPETEEPEVEVKNGVYTVAGVLGYYINDVKQYGTGLIKVEEEYYYVKGNGTVVAGTDYYISNTNDLLPAGVYAFNADGTMIVHK